MKILVFGTELNSQLAAFYLKNDTCEEFEGFFVDDEYKTDDSLSGDPIYSLSEVLNQYDLNSIKVLAPLGPKKINHTRADVYNRLKALGFNFYSYVSTKATNFSSKIGENCFILEDNTLQPYTSIGDNVILWSGNHVGHHSKIKDNVMITSQVVVSGRCIIGENSYIGVNATLRDGITVGSSTFITMGSVVTSNTEPGYVYSGNPAEKKKIPSLKMKL